MLAGVTCGHSLSASIELAAELLRSRLGHEEMLHAVQAALTLGASGHRPSLEMVETLGGSRGAEGALAITLYWALVAADFRSAVLAVNHAGDSTGSMVGNLLGPGSGPRRCRRSGSRGCRPERWLSRWPLIWLPPSRRVPTIGAGARSAIPGGRRISLVGERTCSARHRPGRGTALLVLALTGAGSGSMLSRWWAAGCRYPTLPGLPSAPRRPSHGGIGVAGHPN